MYDEQPSPEEVNEARRRSILKTIRVMGVEELKEFANHIFKTVSDPWYEKYMAFIGENAGSKMYYAKTSDHFEIIYCPEKNAGIWILEELGKGRLREDSLERLKKIVESL
ncbi:MAG TPA: hypothetical protein VM511_10985 [Luteolibacter sp.]|nr:hypothetical protein [Luteolibacter sp.]